MTPMPRARLGRTSQNHPRSKTMQPTDCLRLTLAAYWLFQQSEQSIYWAIKALDRHDLPINSAYIAKVQAMACIGVNPGRT
jgi:hypothetical protein